MVYMERRAGHRRSKRQLLGLELKSTVIIQAFARWRRTVAIHRAIATLTSDQLKDIGHPEASTPTLDVKAGMITNLISMR